MKISDSQIKQICNSITEIKKEEHLIFENKEIEIYFNIAKNRVHLFDKKMNRSFFSPPYPRIDIEAWLKQFNSEKSYVILKNGKMINETQNKETHQAIWDEIMDEKFYSPNHNHIIETKTSKTFMLSGRICEEEMVKFDDSDVFTRLIQYFE